jgi:hypothetical protein
MQFSDFFQFNKFLAPILIKVIYWIGLFFIALTTLMGLFGSSMLSGMMGGFGGGYGGGFSVGGALLAIIFGAIWALIWRVVCEIWIVIFSINDRLGVMSGYTAKTP